MFKRPLPLLAALAITLGALAATRASAMTFAVASECGAARCFVASGGIDEASPKQLQAFLKANGAAPGDRLVLDSQGGDVIASLRMGNVIRQGRLDTAVAAYDQAKGTFQRGGACASACVYAFLGGVERTVGDGARIGVHQIYTAGDTWRMSAQDGMQIMSMVGAHMSHLCGSLDLLIPTLRTPPQEMHWLSPVELARFNVVTEANA